MKRYIKIFFLAILAGVCIGVGGTVYLSLDNKIAGSLLFACGLYAICSQGLYLFTGKVGYLFNNKYPYVIDVIVTWFGNLIGTGLTAGMLLLSRIGLKIYDNANAICTVKFEDSVISLLILGIMCGLLMYVAVDGYKKTNNPLILFVPVSVFILCGFEHCIADMFYFWACGMMNIKGIGILLIITLGNAIGGILIPLIQKIDQN